MTTRPSHRGTRAAAVLTVVLALFAAATALAVPVRGTLSVPRDFAPPAPSAENRPAFFYWEEWNGFVDPRPRRVETPREIAVGLLGDTPGAPDPEFRIDGGNFWPTTMLARVGATLRISNTDACAHELWVAGRQDFTPLQTAPGNARSVTVAEAGDFEIKDRLYEHVRGWVHVVPNLVARGTLEANGSFTFADVPAGAYTLVAYYEGREVANQAVTVAEGESALTIEPAIALNLTAAAAPAAPAPAPAPAAPAAPAPAAQ